MCGLASVSSAALVVTLGDFHADGYGANVTGWFDGNHGGNPWDDTFTDTNSPFPGTGGDKSQAVFSGSGGEQNFLYQVIGTRETIDTALDFSIGLTAFGSALAGTLTVGLYQSATFSGADGTDVHGGAGVTQIGSTVTLAVARAANQAAYETGSISLTTANTTDPIFLRFHFTSAYMGADNISVTPIPEPATMALLGLGGLGLILGRKRR